MVDPDSGRTTYSYDAANNLFTLLNPFGEKTTFTYDALNRAVTVTQANTTTEQSFFNSAGWLTTIRHQKSDGTTLSAFTYTYDNVGNRLSMAEANGDRVTWSYDPIYELVNEKRSGTNAYNTTYTYDPVGNRLTKVDGGTTITTYSYDSDNRLTSEQTGASITTYSYDNNGNTILKNASSQVTTYTYDNENRMTKLQQPTAPAVMTFTYNGLSFRRTLHDGTSLTKFIYAWATGTPGIDPVLLETDVNDITVVEYTPARFLTMLSQRRSTVSKWYHPEAIGSTRQLTDNTQTVTDTYLYKAFGELVTSTGTTINPLRYVGQANYYDDGRSGLMLLGLRDYASNIGRFLSVDPIINESTNRYAYVDNSVINAIDPTGMQVGAACVAVGVGISLPPGWVIVGVCAIAVAGACATGWLIEKVKKVPMPPPNPCDAPFFDCTQWCDRNTGGHVNICCHSWCTENNLNCYQHRSPKDYPCEGLKGKGSNKKPGSKFFPIF